jgi:hypothetical protein
MLKQHNWVHMATIKKKHCNQSIIRQYISVYIWFEDLVIRRILQIRTQERKKSKNKTKQSKNSTQLCCLSMRGMKSSVQENKFHFN